MNHLKKQQGAPVCPNCFKKYPTIKYLVTVGKFDIYFCRNCETGFTYPIPKDIGNYYHSTYWISPGIIGQIKNLLFNFFQKRRVNWVNKYIKKGKVLDVGSGEGSFSKNAPVKLDVLSIDSKTAQIANPDVKKVDFLKWRNKEKFDVVVFWESLEHTTNPQAYLKKASKVIKDKGLIFIEYPRFNSLELKIFGRHWFHLDVPRHSSHLTDKGLAILLRRANLMLIKQISVPAFEYTIWGLVASVLDIFEIKPTDKLKGIENLAIVFALIPLAILAFIIEVFFSTINQSPIGLVIAKKK